MSIPSIANVQPTIDTFETWVDKTNTIAEAMRVNVVTTQANSTGSATTGNAAISGTVSATSLVATTALRGGTVSSSGNLSITSNTTFTGANVTIDGAYATISANTSGRINISTLAIDGNTVNVSANLNVKSNSLTVIDTGRIGVNTATTQDAALTVVGAMDVSGNSAVDGNMVLGGDLTAGGNASFDGSLSTNGSLSVAEGLSAIGNVVFSNTIAITGSAVFSNTITVNGSITVAGPINGTVNGTSNTCARTITAGDWLSGGGTLTNNITLNVNAASTSTANTVVVRNANGSFSANVVTANVVGNANTSTYLFYNTAFRSATDTNTGNSIVARDGNGSFSANVITGTATAARYADLAENYLADDVYPVGTVVVVGGSAEITASSTGQRALGVVSERPAYLMNKDLEGGTAVALKGRVPIRVIGPVTKGEGLVADINGCASAHDALSVGVFALALESNVDFGEKMVEGVVL